MRNLKDGEVESFGSWTFQVQGKKVFVVGNGFDFVVDGTVKLLKLIEGLRSCMLAVHESGCKEIRKQDE